MNTNAASPSDTEGSVFTGARPCQGRGRGFESLRPLQDLADLTTVGARSRGNTWGNSSYCKCPFGRWSRALLTSRTINRSTYFATDLRSAGHKRAVPIHHRPRVGESVRFLRSDSNSPSRGSNPPAPARQCGALIHLVTILSPPKRFSQKRNPFYKP